MADEFVRVKDNKTGHEFSWPTHLVEAAEAAETGGFTRTDKDAVDRSGDPLPPKHKTTVEKAAASRTSAPKTAQPEPGQQADTQKEND